MRCWPGNCAAWRSGAEILNPLWFFLIVITLFPFGVGAAPQLLAQIAPGVVWVAALLAALLVMDRLFRDDWQDGSPRSNRCSCRRRWWRWCW